MSYTNSKRNIIVDAELVEIKMALRRMPFVLLFEDYFFLVYLKFLPGYIAIGPSSSSMRNN